jgi:hypothetical protein
MSPPPSIPMLLMSPPLLPSPNASPPAALSGLDFCSHLQSFLQHQDGMRQNTYVTMETPPMSPFSFPPPPFFASPPTTPTTTSLLSSPGGASIEDGGFDDSSYVGEEQGEKNAAGIVRATVEMDGFISLHLRESVRVDVAANKAVRIINPNKETKIALSGCGTQMALMHPQGRMLQVGFGNAYSVAHLVTIVALSQYNSRIEVQTDDSVSVKNAKMWYRGVSFTASNCALNYLLDQAGARSTTDAFYDLYANDIADSEPVE